MITMIDDAAQGMEPRAKEPDRQKWRVERHENPLDGSFVTQRVWCRGIPDGFGDAGFASVLVSGQTGKPGACLVTRKLFTPNENSRVKLLMAFDSIKDDGMMFMKSGDDGMSWISFGLPGAVKRWIDCFDAFSRFYVRVTDDAGESRDYDFDISGPITPELKSWTGKA